MSRISKNVTKAEKYQEMDEITHILTRPDMYVGSIDKEIHNEYIVSIDEGDIKIVKKPIEISQGFIRIFIEILSNAIDNCIRSSSTDNKCTKIKVNINKETGETSVWNDGNFIPIVKKEDGRYVHSLIFGHFRAGENLDDTKQREVSGRNGYGSKLTNVYSKLFRVEGIDSEEGLKFVQEWSNNMREVSKVKITKSKQKGSTCITWIPDFEKFGFEGYTDDIYSLFYKYVIDTTMLSGVTVFFNDEKIGMKNLESYARLYLNDKETKEICYHKDENNEVVILPNTLSEEFISISFVNGIYTMNGGKHVESWSESIFRTIVDKINGKGGSEKKETKKKENVKKINISDVKKFFVLFVNCKVINPKFDSQSKHFLKEPNVISNFPSKNYTKINKWGVMSKIEEILRYKELSTLKDIESKKRGFTKVDKLESANYEGTKKSSECILIICEGDSAKTYAVTGIEHGINGKKGRDWFGILPVQGKILNVRNASIETLSKNKVITSIINSLGLRFDVDYTDEKEYKKLKYGTLMTLTDADVDGFHILGLVQNMVEFLFPSLLKRDKPFIIHMNTPIATVKIGKENKMFFDEREYNEFMKQTNNKYESKYYKGLATSKRQEVKETFGKKLIEFTYTKELDGKSLSDNFDKEESDERKNMLSKYNPESYKNFDNSIGISKMSIKDFLENYMIQFNIANCARMIPSLMDGLKESQRKILYGSFKRNLNSEIKVSQLAGYVSEHTSYHHGEQSLLETIINMASCYVGGNNLPLFTRGGEFGSRKQLGKDAGSARYIFTCLEKISRIIYDKEDDFLLEKNIDDGMIVEPKFYVPVIPMVLANGQTGIASGWSSKIPAYNPICLANFVDYWIDNNFSLRDENGEFLCDDPEPWYIFYEGEIEKEKDSDKKYITKGIIERIDEETICVKELPIGKSTDDFYDFLQDLMVEKKIESIRNLSTVSKVNFIIKENKGMKLDIKSLKLTSTLSTTNIVLFDENGKIKKYDTICDVIENFCKVKYEYIVKRKNNILNRLKKEIDILKNKRRFIEEIIEDKIVIYKKNEEEIIKILKDNNYIIMSDEEKEYNYLLNLNMKNFTKEKIKSLDEIIEKTIKTYEDLSSKTESQIWKEELDIFREEYVSMMNKLKIELENIDSIENEKDNKKSKRKIK